MSDPPHAARRTGEEALEVDRWTGPLNHRIGACAGQTRIHPGDPGAIVDGHWKHSVDRLKGASIHRVL